MCIRDSAILRHHVVYSDMLTNHTSAIEEGEVLHPVVVVHQLRLVRPVSYTHLIIDAKSLLYPNFITNKITIQIRKDLKGYL